MKALNAPCPHTQAHAQGHMHCPHPHSFTCCPSGKSLLNLKLSAATYTGVDVEFAQIAIWKLPIFETTPPFSTTASAPISTMSILQLCAAAGALPDTQQSSPALEGCACPKRSFELRAESAAAQPGGLVAGAAMGTQGGGERGLLHLPLLPGSQHVATQAPHPARPGLWHLRTAWEQWWVEPATPTLPCVHGRRAGGARQGGRHLPVHHVGGRGVQDERAGDARLIQRPRHLDARVVRPPLRAHHAEVRPLQSTHARGEARSRGE